MTSRYSLEQIVFEIDSRNPLLFTALRESLLSLFNSSYWPTLKHCTLLSMSAYQLYCLHYTISFVS